jgi:hypothetical protein
VACEARFDPARDVGDAEADRRRIKDNELMSAPNSFRQLSFKIVRIIEIF